MLCSIRNRDRQIFEELGVEVRFDAGSNHGLVEVSGFDKATIRVERSRPFLVVVEGVEINFNRRRDLNLAHADFVLPVGP